MGCLWCGCTTGNARRCHPDSGAPEFTPSFYPGYRAEAFIRQNFQPASEIQVGKTEISGTVPIRSTGPMWRGPLGALRRIYLRETASKITSPDIAYIHNLHQCMQQMSSKYGQSNPKLANNPGGHPACRGTHDPPTSGHLTCGRRLTSSFPVRSKWTKYYSRNSLFSCIPFERSASVAIVVALANPRKLSDSEP